MVQIDVTYNVLVWVCGICYGSDMLGVLQAYLVRSKSMCIQRISRCSESQ